MPLSYFEALRDLEFAVLAWLHRFDPDDFDRIIDALDRIDVVRGRNF